MIWLKTMPRTSFFHFGGNRGSVLDALNVDGFGLVPARSHPGGFVDLLAGLVVFLCVSAVPGRFGGGDWRAGDWTIPPPSENKPGTRMPGSIFGVQMAPSRPTTYQTGMGAKSPPFPVRFWGGEGPLEPSNTGDFRDWEGSLFY